jgi:uncharacterized membrane protein YccC
LIAVAIDPSGWGLVAVVGILAYLTYAVFSASFTAGTAMMTGVIVFLLHAVVGDSVTTALDRGLDTVIGGGIGLIAYALWPTWSAHSIGPLLARLVDAQDRYMETILQALGRGVQPDVATLRWYARQARVAFTDCEAAVTLARSEPQRGDTDPQQASVSLGALRRVVFAVHALRLEPAVRDGGPKREDLWPLAKGFDQALKVTSASLRVGHPAGSLPPLRRLFRDVAWQPGDEPLRRALDELVDAINAAAASAGLQLP